MVKGLVDMRSHCIYTIPAAGMSKNAFQSWNDHLNDQLVLKSLEISGRGGKMDKRLNGTIEECAKELSDEILDDLEANQDYSILGHSVGAIIAFEIVRLIEKRNHKRPTNLIVLSKNPPDNIDQVRIHELPDEIFLEHINKFDGLPFGMRNNRLYRRLFLPILRNDVMLSEKYYKDDTHKICTPIHCFVGDEEMDTVDNTMHWVEFTKANFNHIVLKGGHFNYLTSPQKVCNEIDKIILLEV
jgi:medium-chain acyl-[acyl-carrier-protein] hydrolase